MSQNLDNHNPTPGDGLLTRIQRRVSDFHHDSNGAVALLCLAGLLIILMTGLILYDAGGAARDKMDVQMASDTAAYSHAAVKARSMNMISYANVAKRMIYSYNVIYVAGYLALLEATAMYSALAAKYAAKAVKAFKACVTCASGVGAVATLGAACALCLTLPDELKATLENTLAAVEGIIQTLMETIEFLNANLGELITNRAPDEVAALDTYQNYMMQMTPWWAWAEGATRAMRNGATISASWPVPPGSGNLSVAGKVGQFTSALSGAMSAATGCSNSSGSWPQTGRRDALPLTKTPVNSFISHGKLCLSTRNPISNWEFFTPQYIIDHWQPSEGYWGGNHNIWDGTDKPHKAPMSPQMAVTTFELLMQAPIGCINASMTLGQDTVLPYELNTDVSVPWMPPPGPAGGQNLPQEWLRQSSNLTIAYKRDDERFNEARDKYNYLDRDYQLGLNDEFLYRNGGYWAMTRAEMVYDSSIAGAVSSFMENLPGSMGSLGNNFNGVDQMLSEPNMFTPGWTARLRPFRLNGEQLPTGLGPVYHDVQPFLAAGMAAGVALEEGQNPTSGFNLGSTLGAIGLDLLYMERVACSMDQSKLHSGAFEK